MRRNTARRSAGLLCVIIVLFCGVLVPGASAQRMKRMEFKSQPIVDILLVLSEASGVSIVPDETVTGSASFYFTEADFEQSLASFLATYKLYYTRTGNTCYVTKIQSSFDKNKNTVILKADDVDIQYLVRALARAIGKTILFDPLPQMTLSVNVESLTPEKALDVLTKKLADYRLESDGNFFYIRRIPVNPMDPYASAAKKPSITRTGDTYAINLDKGRFLDVLVELFAKAGKEYALLNRIDLVVENIYFSDKSFDQLLRLILEHGNSDYLVSDGVYYLFEVQKKDILRKYRQSIVVSLSYLVAQDVLNLLPTDMSSGTMARLDRTTNSIILTGSDEELGPILGFIRQVDRPLYGLSYQRFDIKYFKARDIVPLIPPKLLPIAPVLLPDGNGFIALVSESGRQDIASFIGIADRKTDGYPVRLKYIKTEELLKNLPPSVVREDIVESGSPSLLFYIGSEDKRKIFLREIELIDRPKPQIRYELLVVQYQKGKGSDFSRSKAEFGPSSSTPGISFSGDLSKLLSLSFDVVAQFGYQFALSLNASLSNNLANVFADTTLNGLSGQETKFQNTDTFRYREIEIDPDTGKQKYTGVTREITSGLILGINGWVSGDGMVTMQVHATVSKRGADTSSTTGNPPPTSEKVVTTNVRTMSGKPVIIGGLLQKSKDVTSSKVPILGDIPLLGLLFRSHTETEENTEMVLYIVPHVTFGDDLDVRTAGRRMESYYRSFVEGFVR